MDRGHARWSCAPALAALALGLAAPGRIALAATLTVQVNDGSTPLTDAIVSLHSPSAAAAVKPANAVLDQRDSQFDPHLLPIPLGTVVAFPNSDNVRHHVYSFSPAKRFELPLYSGTPAAPVVFDRAGVVTMGCNIHDWMIAYVVVLDTPYFGRSSADGRVDLDAPEGDYTLRVWHEGVSAAPPSERAVTLSSDGSVETVSLALAKASAPTQAPVDPRLLELQQKFRSLKRER